MPSANPGFARNKSGKDTGLKLTALFLMFGKHSKTGGLLDPDNMVRDRFLPKLQAAGICAIRFHDLRHTFGAMLIAAGAPLNYVKELMGHASIQIAMDTYGHLIPGVGERDVDRLDAKTTPQQSSTYTQQAAEEEKEEFAEVVEMIGSGGRIELPT